MTLSLQPGLLTGAIDHLLAARQVEAAEPLIHALLQTGLRDEGLFLMAKAAWKKRLPLVALQALNDYLPGNPGHIAALSLKVRVLRSLNLPEADDAQTALWNAFPENSLQKRYFANPVRGLALGSGSNLYEGWLSMDFESCQRNSRIAYFDATEPLCFPDNSIDLIHTEHMIEHIPFADGQFFARECFRVLKPGGRVRIATPDMRRMARLAVEPANDFDQAYVKWTNEQFGAFFAGAPHNRPGFAVNTMFYNHGHCFLFDEDTLKDVMADAGLTALERCEVGKSVEPALCNMERHGFEVPAAVNAYETLIIEGVKPA